MRVQLRRRFHNTSGTRNAPVPLFVITSNISYEQQKIHNECKNVHTHLYSVGANYFLHKSEYN